MTFRHGDKLWFKERTLLLVTNPRLEDERHIPADIQNFSPRLSWKPAVLSLPAAAIIALVDAISL